MKWLKIAEEDERRKLGWELSKMEFLARLLGSKWRAPQLGAGDEPQAVGGYCKGQSLLECQRLFGDRLPEICATCPE